MRTLACPSRLLLDRLQALCSLVQPLIVESVIYLIDHARQSNRLPTAQKLGLPQRLPPLYFQFVHSFPVRMVLVQNLAHLLRLQGDRRPRRFDEA